jgi:hypothetical protein
MTTDTHDFQSRLSTSRDSPSTRTRWKKDFRALVLACMVFALPLRALSLWIDEGEFSQAMLAYKLRQLKSQFEQVETVLLTRGGAESELKKLELEDLYTRITRLETEFQRGEYFPDLLDEQIMTVSEDLRLIVADPSQKGIDHKRADDQSQRLRGPASDVSLPTTQGMIEV